MSMSKEQYLAAEQFVDWLAGYVADDARGTARTQSTVDPRGAYWLGRLAPLIEIASSPLGDRAERLEPCAIGFRCLPRPGEIAVTVTATFVVWVRTAQTWNKSDAIRVSFPIALPDEPGERQWGRDEFAAALAIAAPNSGLAGFVQTELSRIGDGKRELTIELVNDSDPDHANAGAHAKGRFFECTLTVEGLATNEYLLEDLPDSFRYDRRVAAWGLNCGIEHANGLFTTNDLPTFEKYRPVYWTVEDPKPDLSFDTLARDPIPQLSALHDSLVRWGERAWSVDAIRAGTPSWSEELECEVLTEAATFRTECDRIRAGIDLLLENETLARAFMAMNDAMKFSANGKYLEWRPFQIGFMLANIRSCVGDDQGITDIVWFSTGGGKTETYLGIILTAAFYDRLTGKSTGVTAWSRFPLRLLSLQQTQRFANALAGAERVRIELQIPGDPFSLGFLVGSGATPNDVRMKTQWDPDDIGMPDRIRMLKVCPFCRQELHSHELRLRPVAGQPSLCQQALLLGHHQAATDPCGQHGSVARTSDGDRRNAGQGRRHFSPGQYARHDRRAVGLLPTARPRAYLRDASQPSARLPRAGLQRTARPASDGQGPLRRRLPAAGRTAPFARQSWCRRCPLRSSVRRLTGDVVGSTPRFWRPRRR